MPGAIHHAAAEAGPRPLHLPLAAETARVLQRAIAQAAVDLCQDGDAIIINGGTTTFQMVHPLSARRKRGSASPYLPWFLSMIAKPRANSHRSTSVPPASSSARRPSAASHSRSAAFTSNQQASGHLCLDLNNRDLPTQLLGSNPPPVLTALLPGGVDDWLRHLQQSALVSENGGTPLVLDGGRLLDTWSGLAMVCFSASFLANHPEKSNL